MIYEFWETKNTDALTHRFEIALERSRKRVLPEIDLVGELSLGNLKRLRSNVDVLEAKFVRKVDKG